MLMRLGVMMVVGGLLGCAQADTSPELFVEGGEVVVSELRITRHPVSQHAGVGAYVTLTVQAEGGQGLQYQWHRDGVVALGQRSRAMNLWPVKPVDAGRWSCSVTDSIGRSVTSREAVLEVRPAPEAPTIVSKELVDQGEGPLTASTQPRAGFTYLWTIEGGELLSGQGSPSITFQAGAVGSLELVLRIADELGSAKSTRVIQVVAHPKYPDVFAQAQVHRDDAPILASAFVAPGQTITWSLDQGTIIGPADQPVVRYRSMATLGEYHLTATIRSATGRTLQQTRALQVVGGRWLKSVYEIEPRYDHAMIRLRNGRVLVSGGTQLSRLKANELYDPVTATWASVAPMQRARSRHDLALLPDGRVLAVGGTSGESVTSAEIYDPASNSWVDGTTLPQGWNYRDMLVSTGLGAVLVSGWGLGLHVYDSRTGSWNSTAPSFSAQPLDCLALDDGTLVVLGWQELIFTRPPFQRRTAHPIPFGVTAFALASLPGGGVLVIGNDQSAVYDPSLGSWSRAAAAPFRPRSSARTRVSPPLADGRVLVNSNGSVNGTAFYDPAADVWTSELTMPALGTDFAVLESGDVLQAGGGLFLSSSSFVSIYSQARRRWAAPSLGNPTWQRVSHTAQPLADGRVLFVFQSMVTIYDPQANTWVERAPHAPERGEVVTVELDDGEVLFADGTPEVYSTRTDQWRSVAAPLALPGARGARLGNGEVLITSGSESRRFDPRTGAWRIAAPMAEPRTQHTLTMLADGRVMATGGLTSSGTETATAEVYSPQLDSWASLPSLPGARAKHSAQLLPTGEVFVGRRKAGAPAFFSPATGLWREVPELAGNGSSSAQMMSLQSGRLLFVPESACACSPFRTTSLFDPVAGVWSSANDRLARADMTLTQLPNGKVMMTGGTGGNPVSVEFFKE